MENTNQTEKKGLESAIVEAISLPTEKERMIALLDCVKGYKNDFDKEKERYQYMAYFKCKDDFRKQINKIKEIVADNIK